MTTPTSMGNHGGTVTSCSPYAYPGFAEICILLRTWSTVAPGTYELAFLIKKKHELEEATYESAAPGVDDIVGWAASLDPSPDVIHIDMRSPTRNSYLGGRGWATTLWRELRRQLPSHKFLHLTRLPSSVDQLLNSMRTNPVGKPKDAHVQVYPTTNLVHTPPHCDMVCLQDLASGAPTHHSFFPFSWHLANPRW